MNKIKKSLIEKAKKQEIHDLHQEILDKVDTNKVVYEAPAKKKFNFKPVFMSFIPLAGAAAALAIVIASTNSNNSMNVINSEPTVEPTTLPSERPVPTALPSDNPVVPTGQDVPQEIELKEVDDIQAEVLNAYATNVTSLVKVALSFDAISFDPLETSSGALSDDEKNYLKNDLTVCMPTIKDLLEISEIQYNCYLNLGLYEQFNYKLIVKNDSNEYTVYFNDNIVSETYTDDSFKINSKLEGVVINNGKEYLFSGTKLVNPEKVEIKMGIDYEGMHLELIEALDSTPKYTYRYTNIETKEVKKVIIEKTETAVKFSNDYFKVNMNLDDENLNQINCIIRDRSDDLTITLSDEGEQFVYTN